MKEYLYSYYINIRDASIFFYLGKKQLRCLIFVLSISTCLVSESFAYHFSQESMWEGECTKVNLHLSSMLPKFSNLWICFVTSETDFFFFGYVRRN